VKLRVVKLIQKHLVNPRIRKRAGEPGERYALLETTGRKSGEPRQTPVGNGLIGRTFWIVAEHGRQAQYVRNIERDPMVRLKVDGRWLAGTAHLMPEDDPVKRLETLDPKTAREVRMIGTDLLTIRIDLDEG
jgi:deazaflavin-dependent oxidoreductase (nitroreductase family)